MASGKANSYRLAPAAQRDLEDIWDYTAAQWSAAQAETYLRGLQSVLDTIVAQPQIARERREFDPPVRLHPYQSHLIIYREAGEYLDVLRVVHRRRHWSALIDDK